jgi:hypothetical protein
LATYAEVSSKACDTSLLVPWLADLLRHRGRHGIQWALQKKLSPDVLCGILSFLDCELLDIVAGCVIHLDSTVRTLAKAKGLWLTEAERQSAIQAGSKGIQLFGQLSNLCADDWYFHVKPKALLDVVLSAMCLCCFEICACKSCVCVCFCACALQIQAHAFFHILVDLRDCSPAPNYWADTCWMEEVAVSTCGPN